MKPGCIISIFYAKNDPNEIFMIFDVDMGIYIVVEGVSPLFCDVDTSIYNFEIFLKIMAKW